MPCHLAALPLVLGSAHTPSAAPYGERPARACPRLPAPSGAIPRLAGASAAGEPRRQYAGSRPAAAAGRASGQDGLRVTGRTRSERQPRSERGPASWAEQTQPGLRVLAAITAGMVYLQLILEALMRHTGAGLAIPDFPLAFGRLLPPLDSSAVVLHFVHRLGTLVVALWVGWTVSRILSR